MCSNSLKWSEALHSQTIECIESFTESFKNQSHFVVKFEIIKKAPLCTFAEINFGHVPQGYKLSKIKLTFYIMGPNDLERLKSILDKIDVEFHSIEQCCHDTDSE